MITSIVGRLIKKPEVAERIQIPGKHVVNFTVVENRNRGQKRLSVFFNLSVVVATDAQFDFALRQEKGAVLLFASPHVTYVRQTDKSDTEQSINIYAEADSFRLISGAEPAAGIPAPDPAEPAEEESEYVAPPRPAPARPSAPAATASPRRPEPQPTAAPARSARTATARRQAAPPPQENDFGDLPDPFDDGEL